MLWGTFMRIYRNKRLTFLLFFLQIHSSLALTFNFEEEGEVRYSLNDTSRYQTTVLDQKVQTLENADIKVSLSYQDEIYKISKLEKNKKDDNNIFSLIINSSIRVELGEANSEDTSDLKFEKFQLVGTRTDNFTTYFTNLWKFTILPSNPPVFKKVSFCNRASIIFEKDIIFPLVSSIPHHTSFFNNYGMSTFKGNLHFFEGTQPSNASFEYHESLENNLRNYGTIACHQAIYLTGKIFIGEKGKITALQNIYYQYDQRKRTRGPHILPRDINFPIRIVIRIPNGIIDQRFKVASGDFSELCALSFYQAGRPKWRAFRYKANASENGIDVWAYSQSQVILHESKNYQDNGYQLDTNQMTKKWCLNHLLTAFQDLLKDHYYRSEWGEEGRIIENEVRDHLQQALSIIIKEPYKFLLTNPFKEEYQECLVKLLDLKPEDNDLEEINNIFDFTPIRAQGNSIYQSSLSINTQNPLASKMGTPSIPTYYFGRNLSKRIMEEGNFRQKRKSTVDKK
jgi:hypothetical protein